MEIGRSGFVEAAAPGEAATSSDSRAGYVGEAACLGCHKDQSSTYVHTSHHFTSQLASRQSMPKALLTAPVVVTIVDPMTATAEPGLYFTIGARPDGSYYESAYTGWGASLQSRSERMDVITGSGTRGQTYLYWDGDRLFELPVSYWTDGHAWINSPGYQNGSADFARPINPGCMECHSTYIRALSADPLTNRYERASLVAGISCEVCHGPGAEHVRLQATPTADKAASQAILNPAIFTRERQIELCALCHNGIQRQETAPAFSYLPGKPLADFFKPIASDTAEHPDVHGNQVGLLQRSRCFTASATMTCSTCHDVHAPERAAASYSNKCLGCHRQQSCAVAKRLGAKGADRCVECHMPVEATRLIVSETAGQEVRAKMRNHWIKVYPQTPPH